MCHVLVVLEGASKDAENKQKRVSITKDVRKKHKSPTIIFVHLKDKNAQKTLMDYQKRHPSAIRWQQKS